MCKFHFIKKHDTHMNPNPIRLRFKKIDSCENPVTTKFDFSWMIDKVLM